MPSGRTPPGTRTAIVLPGSFPLSTCSTFTRYSVTGRPFSSAAAEPWTATTAITGAWSTRASSDIGT